MLGTWERAEAAGPHGSPLVGLPAPRSPPNGVRVSSSTRRITGDAGSPPVRWRNSADNVSASPKSRWLEVFGDNERGGSLEQRIIVVARIQVDGGSDLVL